MTRIGTPTYKRWKIPTRIVEWRETYVTARTKREALTIWRTRGWYEMGDARYTRVIKAGPCVEVEE